MKKLICGMLVVLGLMLLRPAVGEAIDWVKLSPEEVIDQAEYVVAGTYDLTGLGDELSDSRLWVPFEFKAVQYYRGSGGTVVQTAISAFDIGWVADLQAQGGSFILFLQPDPKEGGLLLPVGGINGIVRVLDGKMPDQSAVDNETYRRFLRENSGDNGITAIDVLPGPIDLPDLRNINIQAAGPVTDEPNGPSSTSESKDGMILAYFAIPGVVALMGTAIIVWKLKK